MCTQGIRDCPISLEGKIIEADLIIFGLLGFDLILGMDWLSKHYAKIHCQRKEIVFDSPDVGRIHCVGGTVKAIPSLILALQVRNCTTDKVISYLDLIFEKSNRDNEIDGIPIVEDFYEVLIVYLLGLPPIEKQSLLYSQTYHNSHSKNTIPYGPIRVKRIESTNIGTIETRIYLSEFFTLGCASFVRKEE